jgi:dTDP-glucose 4,6-dehydratase
LDVSKLEALGWRSSHTCAEAIVETVHWYQDNPWWWRKIKSGEHYQAFYQRWYAGREVA